MSEQHSLVEWPAVTPTSAADTPHTELVLAAWDREGSAGCDGSTCATASDRIVVAVVEEVGYVGSDASCRERGPFRPSSCSRASPPDMALSLSSKMLDASTATAVADAENPGDPAAMAASPLTEMASL